MSFKLEVSNHILRTHKISGTIVQTWKQNTGIRFAISGVLGNLIFFSLDKLLLPIIVKCADSGKSATVSAASKWIRRNAESVSFFVAYLLDIIAQRKSFGISFFMSSCRENETADLLNIQVINW